jgi:hypothetical protein
MKSQCFQAESKRRFDSHCLLCMLIINDLEAIIPGTCDFPNTFSCFFRSMIG